MSERILVIEDSPFFSSKLKAEIESVLKLEAIVANSKAEAVALLEADSTEWFVAVVDLNLPDSQDGEIVDVVAKFGVPSIVFTGEFRSEVRERLLAKEVIDYVVKGTRTSIQNVVAMIDRIGRNRSIKVMIVDDSSAGRSHLRRLLKKHKYNVVEASDGVQALEVLEANPDIKLIITDYHMPNMDGFELTGNIRALHPGKRDLAIIGMSAAGDKILSAKFLKSGANDFIMKPFLNEELFCRASQNIERIEHIQEMEAASALKNKFLGMAAHDLRNPLFSIRGFSELLLGMEPEDPSERREFLDMIHDVSNQMLNLLNDLLDVSAIESGKFELNITPKDLTLPVRERVRLMGLNAKPKNIEIVTQAPAPVIGLFDPERINQVIDNLLSNAVKFSPPGSRIHVNVQTLSGKAEFSVTDHGPGVGPEDIKRLFGEFQKLTARPTGGEKSTGLGLAIVKRIIDAHGGEIRVTSELGVGTTFTVTLPTPDSQP
jgi:two-component system, sensor histidine kinase and response regulator